MNFEVMSHDVHGAPARCSYCERGAGRTVVVLPLTDQQQRVTQDDAWIGVCAYCVLDMAKALQAAEGKP